MKGRRGLFDVLAKVGGHIVPGTTFFNEFVPNSRTERNSYHTRCMAAFADRDLVFFDPDNGLEVKSATGKKRSKHVLLDEVADHYAGGRSVLFYQHLGQTLPRRAFAEEKAAKLRAVLPGASMSAFDTPHVVFLLAARPEHAKRVFAAAAETERDGSSLKSFLPVILLDRV